MNGRETEGSDTERSINAVNMTPRRATVLLKTCQLWLVKGRREKEDHWLAATRLHAFSPPEIWRSTLGGRPQKVIPSPSPVESRPAEQTVQHRCSILD